MFAEDISEDLSDPTFTGFYSISGYLRNLRGRLLSSERFSEVFTLWVFTLEPFPGTGLSGRKSFVQFGRLHRYFQCTRQLQTLIVCRRNLPITCKSVTQKNCFQIICALISRDVVQLHLQGLRDVMLLCPIPRNPKLREINFCQQCAN